MFGHSADYGALKPFGCLAYAANISPSRGKFDTRSLKCVFLGFDSYHKGYILYDLDNGNILISRDVKFILNKFPFLTRAPTVIYEPILQLPTVPMSPDDQAPTTDTNLDISHYDPSLTHLNSTADLVEPIQLVPT